MKKWFVIGVIVVFVIGGGSCFFLSKGSEPTVARAMAASVEKGDLQVKVSGSGSVEAVNNEDITSKVNAEVDEVLVEKNEVVAKGDELITFTDGSDSIEAPFAGTITVLNVAEGDRVAINDVVAHVTDYKKLQTSITVDELDITKIKKGQEVEITANAFEDETFTGKVKTVAREGEYSNGASTFEVKVTINDPGKLKVGMSVEVNILTENAKDVLYVPIEAVQIDGDEKYVNVQTSQATETEAATTSKQVVKTGINNERFIEIVEGLEEGQLISLPVSISEENNNSFRGMGEMMREDQGGGMPGGGMMMPSGGMPSGGGPGPGGGN